MKSYRTALTFVLAILNSVTGMIQATAPVTSVFDGYELISTNAQTDDQIEFLHLLENAGEKLDFWQYPMRNGSQNGIVLVAPDVLSSFKEKMRLQNIPWTVASTNIVPLLEATFDKPEVVRISSSTSFHTKYHDYEEIESFLHGLAGNYSGNIEVSYLASPTYERRKVVVAKLYAHTRQSICTRGKKKAIVIGSGAHAREWLSPASNLYVIEKLLQGYKQGLGMSKYMLETYDWYFVPVVNPDGYQYTRQGVESRLWRKNRRVFPDQNCVGVDLNRNFDNNHGTVGASNDCESLTYCGPKPFSEAETRNMRDLLGTISGRFIGYLSVHTFGQAIVVPWGYSKTDKPGNYKELLRVANLMKESLTATHGLEFHTGSEWEINRYLASGRAIDWALATYPDTYTLTLELRPNRFFPGYIGFLVGPDNIIPSGEEYLESLKVYAKQIKFYGKS